VLTFTGPPTLTVGASTIESLNMTTVMGAPISGRKVTIALGIKPRIIQHCTATTNASGVAACNIGKAPSYKRYRYITMTFAGDPPGARHDYAAGQARVKVLMKPRSIHQNCDGTLPGGNLWPRSCALTSANGRLKERR
jgi:hypothetical protein